MPTFKESRASGGSEHSRCPLSEGGLPSTAVSSSEASFLLQTLLDAIVFNPCSPTL